MKIRNDGFCINLGLLLIASDYVHEEQLNFMEKLSKRYGFSMDSIWETMRELNHCCKDIHSSFAEESLLVRNFYRRDIVKLACLDGMIDSEEDKIILQTTGMVRKEYERNAARYLNYFHRKTRRETFLQRTARFVHGIFHPQNAKKRSLEECAEEHRFEIASYDQSNSLQELLNGYASGLTKSKLTCKNEMLAIIENLFSRIQLIHDNSNEITVAIVGKTKAGKTTLFNAMIRSDFYRLIGEGKQGTTKLVRAGHWHGIRLIDTPGFGAMYADGRNDEAVTVNALRIADFLIVVIPGDTQEAGLKDFYLECEKTGKPVFYVQNVKRFLNKSERVLKASIQYPAAWRQDEAYDENFRILEEYFAKRGTYKALLGRSCIVSYSREMMSGHIGCVEGIKDVFLTRGERGRIKAGSGFPEFEMEFEKFVRVNYRFACTNRFYPEFFKTISELSELLANEREMLSVQMSKIVVQRDEALVMLDRAQSLCIDRFDGELSRLRTSGYGDDVLEKLIATKKIKQKNFVNEAETVCGEIQEHANSFYKESIEEARNWLVSIAGGFTLEYGDAGTIETEKVVDAGEWAVYTGKYARKLAGTVISAVATIGSALLGAIPPLAVGVGVGGNLIGDQLSRNITFAGIRDNKHSEILDKLRWTVERSFDTVKSGYAEAIESSFASSRDRVVGFFREQIASTELRMETVSDAVRRLQEMQDAADRLRAKGYLKAVCPDAKYIWHEYGENHSTMTICAEGVASVRLECPGLTIEIKGD